MDIYTNGYIREVMDTIEDCTADGWWDWHIKEDYEYMSPRFWKILGYDKDKDEITDHPTSWQNKMFKEDLAKALQKYDEHIKSKGKTPYILEARYKHRDGHTIWVICRGRVILWDDNGDPVRMVGVHIDITKLKQTEAELNKKIEDLEARDRTLQSLRELLDIANKVGKK